MRKWLPSKKAVGLWVGMALLAIISLPSPPVLPQSKDRHRDPAPAQAAPHVGAIPTMAQTATPETAQTDANQRPVGRPIPTAGGQNDASGRMDIPDLSKTSRFRIVSTTTPVQSSAPDTANNTITGNSGTGNKSAGNKGAGNKGAGNKGAGTNGTGTKGASNKSTGSEGKGAGTAQRAHGAQSPNPGKHGNSPGTHVGKTGQGAGSTHSGSPQQSGHAKGQPGTMQGPQDVPRRQQPGSGGQPPSPPPAPNVQPQAPQPGPGQPGPTSEVPPGPSGSDSQFSPYAPWPTARLRVRVIDGRTLQPLPGAEVVLIETEQRMTTNQDGYTPWVDAPIIRNPRYRPMVAELHGQLGVIVYKNGYRDSVHLGIRMHEGFRAQTTVWMYKLGPGDTRVEPVLYQVPYHHLWLVELADRFRSKTQPGEGPERP